MTFNFGLRAVMAPPPIPSYATAFGISQYQFFDGFDSDTTIDKTNSLASGFNWYVSGIPSFQGNSLANSPATSGQYTVAGSVLTVLANTCPAPEGAWQFTSIGFNHADPSIQTQGVPLISGAKPFYFEGRTICGDGTQAINVFWLWDTIANLRYVQNSGVTGRYAEFDLNETGSAHSNNQLLHSWPDASASDIGGGGTLTSFPETTFNRWGILVVPRSYNGGTGLAQFYLNGTPSVAAINWSGADTYGIEASNYMVLFGGGSSAPHFQIDYIGCAVHP